MSSTWEDKQEDVSSDEGSVEEYGEFEFLEEDDDHHSRLEVVETPTKPKRQTVTMDTPTPQTSQVCVKQLADQTIRTKDRWTQKNITTPSKSPKYVAARKVLFDSDPETGL